MTGNKDFGFHDELKTPLERYGKAFKKNSTSRPFYFTECLTIRRVLYLENETYMQGKINYSCKVPQYSTLQLLINFQHRFTNFKNLLIMLIFSECSVFLLFVSINYSIYSMLFRYLKKILPLEKKKSDCNFFEVKHCRTIQFSHMASY